MKVILVADVPRVGKAGEIKEVKKGYAFNFLLPEGMAEIATAGMIRSVTKSLAKRNIEKTAKITALADSLKKLDGITLTVSAKAQDGKLFGSVTAADIVAVAKSNDIELIDDMIQLEHPIKTIGEHAVKLIAGSAEARVMVSVIAA